MSISTNVHQLTRPHITSDGMGGYNETEALLDQLQDAIKPNAGGGASGGGGAKLPVNATAIALLQDIEKEAESIQRDRDISPPGNLAKILAEWEESSKAGKLNAEWDAYIERVTLEWVDQIGQLLSPIKPYHPAVSCPACGLRFHGPERKPCLAVHWLSPDGTTAHPEAWTMNCAACAATWEGNELGAIAEAIKALAEGRGAP